VSERMTIVLVDVNFSDCQGKRGHDILLLCSFLEERCSDFFQLVNSQHIMKIANSNVNKEGVRSSVRELRTVACVVVMKRRFESCGVFS
jgi:hypothetical protein